jgi:hypothetical protein
VLDVGDAEGDAIGGRRELEGGGVFERGGHGTTVAQTRPLAFLRSGRNIRALNKNVVTDYTNHIPAAKRIPQRSYCGGGDAGSFTSEQQYPASVGSSRDESLGQ